MRWKIYRLSVLMLPNLLGLLSLSLRGQTTPSFTQPSTKQTGSDNSPQNAPQSSQVISQSGLLPIFAVDMQFDQSWVDGNDVPSKSAQFSHSGVSDTFQQSWDVLKSGGFNMIRFPVEVKDSQAAARLANLCIWAKANSVSLIPVLKGGGAKQKDQKDKALTADDVNAFLSAVVSRIRGGDAQQSAAYTQIAYFQIEGAMNHAGYYPKITPDDARAALLGVSDALRKAETQALQGTAVQATPILISVSFDYELIRQGAIAGVPLDPSAEQKAQASLNQFLAPLANAASIEAINVEWFPRSISSGDVDHFAALIRALKGALPAKQLLLTTGFSSAFNPADQQTQFFTLAFSNLSDFRASDGVSSTFLGAIFRQAFKGASADAATPAGSSDPSQWNWSEKAQQLSQMWSQGGKSDELSWWLNKVADNMGFLAMQPNAAGGLNIVPLPAEQAFQQIASTVAQVSQNVVATAAVPGTGSPTQSASTPPSAATGPAAVNPGQAPQNQVNPIGGQSFVPSAAGSTATAYGAAPAYAVGAQATGPSGASPYQQLLFTILQQFTTQMATSFAARLAAPSGQGMLSQYAAQTQYGAQSQYSANPSVGSQNFASGTQPQAGYGTSSNGASTQPPSPTGSTLSGTTTYPTQTSTVGGAPSGAGASSGTGTYPLQTPPTGATPTSVVTLGPEDVTVDSANVTVGQTVHITAQVHNTSADQDISGLTVQLVDPSNPTANQAMQRGVSVPRSGTTPVQLGWTPASPGTGTYQMSVQVLDGAGAQVASAALPAITVATASASGSVAIPAQSTPVQPQIAFFGVANPNSVATPGQLPSLSVQVTNPANVPTQAAQVQLFVDGTPGQTQSLGLLLPKQSRSVVFTGIAAPPGNHATTVTVTTADGATVSASANASSPSPGTVPAAAAGTGTNANPVSGGTPLHQNLVAVRSGAPTRFTVSQSASPLNVGAISNGSQSNAGSASATGPNVASALAPTQTTSASSTAPSSSATSQVPATAPATAGSSSTNPNLLSRPGPAGVANTSPARTAVRSVLPSAASSAPTNRGSLVRPSPSGSSVPSNVASSTPQVRTIAPGTPPASSQTTSTPANGGSLVRPGPSGSSVSPSSSAPQVRTITPGRASSSANANTPVRPGPGGTAPATITPGLAGSRPGAPPGTTPGSTNLAVSPGDIHFSPALRSGQAATFTALIRNNGPAGTQEASVVFRLFVNGQQAAVSAPTNFNVPAHGTFLASWSTTIPASRQIQIVVSVTANGDVNTANKQAALSLAVSQ